MRAAIVLSTLAGVHGSASSRTLDQVCSNFASAQDEVSVTFTSGFDSLFSDSIDCSCVPTNPRLGYSLTGASLAECAAAGSKKLSGIPYAAQQLHGPQCMEKILDEKESSATIVVQFPKSEVKLAHPILAAVKFGFDAAGKIKSYEVAFDSYPLLFTPGSLKPQHFTGQVDSGRIPEASGQGRAAWKIQTHGGPVASAVSKVCDSITYSTPVHVGSAKWAEKVREAFEQFTPTVSCAENRNNPLVGYSLEGVSFGDCASHSTYSHHLKIDELLGDCVQNVNDERSRTSASWMTYTSQGDAEPFKFSGVSLYWLNEQGKIFAYLCIYDTWDVISRAQGTALLADSVVTDANHLLPLLMAVPLLSVVGLFAFRKLRPTAGAMAEALLDKEVQ